MDHVEIEDDVTMSRTQPTFGLPATFNTAFAPSRLTSAVWNSFSDQLANGPGFLNSQAQVPKANSSSNERYRKLFRRKKSDGLEPSAVSFEVFSALKAAPLFSCSIQNYVNQNYASSKPPLAQYGVVGMIAEDDKAKAAPPDQDKLLFSNTEEPWSTFICGSQGSGKSHTLSCLLENSLLPEPEIGTLKTPLTGLVFHYDKFANFGSGQACEAAYLCAASKGGVPVQVLVAPTSLKRMAHQYNNLPGLPEGCIRPQVLPLYFSQKQLSVNTMMTLMAVNDDEKNAPLYIHAIRQLLRDIAIDTQDSPGFDYRDFRQRLACMNLTGSQTGPLTLRLQLLESLLLDEDQTAVNQAAFKEMWTFRPGTLTIIDLSDQFVDETDACALFSICLKLFMADWQSNPRIIALDEAHKFLTASTEATKLTTDLISVIRQQRHMSARVVVATQDPTVSAKLLDLCNVSIIHRFSSPKWFQMLHQHLAGACIDDKVRDSMFGNILKLSTGEALVFCPTALIDIESGRPAPLRNGVIKVLVRDRVSADGGQSIQASSRDEAVRSITVPIVPEYRRFRGDDMPALGSLAKKTVSKPLRGLPGNKGPVTQPLRVLRSTASSQTTSVKQEAQVPATKPGPNSRARALSIATGGTSTDESASTDQDSESDSDSLSAVVPQLKQVTSVQPFKNSKVSSASTKIAISKKQFPAGHKNSNTGVSEDKLKRLMYQVVDKGLRDDLVQDPTPYLKASLADVSQLCGLKGKHLGQHGLEEGCTERSSVKLLKKVIKTYYDDRGVSRADRCSWLR